jgi:hypothetical protein
MRFILTMLVVALALPQVAFAGGWAVTTVDALPSTIKAGETYAIGYTIRQHGQTPYVGARSAIEVRSPSGSLTRFDGQAEGPRGHYVAQVRFAEGGEWQWRVDQSPFAPQALGTITIEPSVVQQAEAPSAQPLPTSMQVAALALAAAAMVLFGRRALSGARRAG